MNSILNGEVAASQIPSISSSLRDAELEDSDMDDSVSSSYADDESNELDYWFGKHYFRFVLAQDVFTKASAGCSIVTIDSSLEKQIRNFPYNKVMMLCQEEKLDFMLSPSSSEEDSSKLLMYLIGCVMRKESHEGKRKLLSILRTINEVNTSHGNHAKANDITSDEKPSSPEIPAQLLRHSSKGKDSDVSTYTETLYKRGDKDGYEPQYTFKHVPLTSSWYKAVVSYNGYCFEGHGSSKQQAKHSASKEACDYLGLSQAD